METKWKIFYSSWPTTVEISPGHRNSDALSPGEAINGGHKLKHADGGFRRHISYENPAPRPPGAGTKGRALAAGGLSADSVAGRNKSPNLFGE